MMSMCVHRWQHDSRQVALGARFEQIREPRELTQVTTRAKRAATNLVSRSGTLYHNDTRFQSTRSLIWQ
jgi:hypothetical protein